jgi:AmmeMemoRadiSam system protein A
MIRMPLIPPDHAVGDGLDATDAGLPLPVTLDSGERDGLLVLARAAVAAAAGAGTHESVEVARQAFVRSDRRAAAFVTLTEGGELRGCMGNLDADLPVADSVMEAASCAALLDPRFRRVTAAELDGIELEVSVLGPMVPLREPLGFRLGIDGIVVQRGGRRGLLLPDVAPKLGFDRVAMLDTACRKASLPDGAWRMPGTTVLAFQTDRFGGPAPAGPAAPAEPTRPAGAGTGDPVRDADG